MGAQRRRLAARHKPAQAMQRLVSLRRAVGRRHAERLVRGAYRERAVLHVHDGHFCLAR